MHPHFFLLNLIWKVSKAFIFMQVSETKKEIASEWSNNDKPGEAERTIIYSPNISLIKKKKDIAKLHFQMVNALRHHKNLDARRVSNK